MSPGEYVGKDGRTYWWEITNGQYAHTFYGGGWRTIAPEDWPAAKAALDALIAEGDAEWVELPTPDCAEPYIRISLNGQRVQQRTTEDRWIEYDAWWIKAAYRKGREVTQAEHEALREQVRALCEAVLEEDRRIGPWCQHPRWRACVELAKAVQL
jgi:hypothetical protein